MKINFNNEWDTLVDLDFGDVYTTDFGGIYMKNPIPVSGFQFNAYDLSANKFVWHNYDEEVIKLDAELIFH